MDDLKSVQQRWLDASRRHHAPSAAAVARMRKGLQARIAAGEPAPVWRVETPLEAAAPPSARWRPWVIGGGVLLAAAVALLWASRGSITMVAQTDSPNAAAYDADRGISGGTPIIPVDRRSPTTRPAAAPPVEATPPPPETTTPDPPPATPRSAPARPTRPRSTTATTPAGPSLDVAGEAAVLRRAKAAIDNEAWSTASRELEDYERRHPSGVLTPEARALRVIVACGRNASDATMAAQQFLRRHASSPMRDRIRRACSIESSQ